MTEIQSSINFFSNLGRQRPTGYIPNKPFMVSTMFTNHIEISGIPLITVLDQFTELLSQIEGLTRYEWDSDHFVWHIEYASRPLEMTLDSYSGNIVNMGRWAALRAANVAYDKFPHLFTDDDFDDKLDQQKTIFDIKKWHQSEIRFYWDQQKKCLFIHFQRLSGCSSSFYYVWHKIVDHFSLANITFMMRKNYLSLIEGSQIDYNDHTQKYLMNELVSRDVCSYLAPSI
jgi:hypothetical protein